MTYSVSLTHLLIAGAMAAYGTFTAGYGLGRRRTGVFRGGIAAVTGAVAVLAAGVSG